MAAVVPTAPKCQLDTITVTGATGVGTLIFDSRSHPCWWNVRVENLDADAGDVLWLGFTSAVDVNAGLHVGILADGTVGHHFEAILPPGTTLYANCTNAETRAVVVAAIPHSI